jgi:hypothetical protein
MMMETSNALFLACVFGPLLVLIGLWMLFFTKNLTKINASLRTAPEAIWLIAFINMLVGLTVINLYNVWSMDNLVFVTLLGWFSLIRGVVALFFPKSLLFMNLKKETHFKVLSIVPLVWGAILWWSACH